jgi:hypothetical protein
LGKTLVVGQAALSLVLVFGAVLFVRTLLNLENRNTGFDKENLLLFGVNPAKAGYKASASNEFAAAGHDRPCDWNSSFSAIRWVRGKRVFELAVRTEGH